MIANLKNQSFCRKMLVLSVYSNKVEKNVVWDILQMLEISQSR